MQSKCNLRQNAYNLPHTPGQSEAAERGTRHKMEQQKKIWSVQNRSSFIGYIQTRSTFNAWRTHSVRQIPAPISLLDLHLHRWLFAFRFVFVSRHVFSAVDSVVSAPWFLHDATTSHFALFFAASASLLVASSNRAVSTAPLGRCT